MLQSLLAQIPITVLEYGYKIGLNWLGKFAQAIIEGVGVIGFGIIVFTIVLKAITLPFDIYQRISMRKQNLVMKSMQADLEKLQQQYANDKTTYNKKMTELYKKNGYSMLGACLPMILSLVILIVAFQGFRTYSQYANLAMYEQMSRAYSEEILKYAPEFKDFGEGRNYFILAGEGEEENLSEGKLVWQDDRTISGTEIGLSDKVTVRLYVDGEKKTVETTSAEQFKFVSYSYWIEEEVVKFSYHVNSDEFDKFYEANKDKPFDASAEPTVDKDGQTVAPATMEDVYKSVKEGVVADGISEEEDAKDGVTTGRFVARMGATAAANWYRAGGDSHFLWVKNVWYPDVAYEHPIAKYSKLKSQLNNKVTLQDGRKVALSVVLGPDAYEDLTSCLSAEKGQPNGYFILIILSIGLMVLSQFISMRSNKESNQYQTVDGQGAKTQKMMLIIMPVMYAIFAFMYSAAFSIYMTMSSLISLLTTLISNLIIGRVFKKKEQAAEKEKISYKYAWQMTEKEKRAKEKQAKKEAKMQERAERFKNRK